VLIVVLFRSEQWVVTGRECWLSTIYRLIESQIACLHKRIDLKILQCIGTDGISGMTDLGTYKALVYAFEAGQETENLE